MIEPQAIISLACNIALVVLGISFFLTVFRVVRGPTLPDRVLALDMLVGIAIGFIAVMAIKTGYTLYIDIAISLCLVGFLATVAFARFILARGVVGEKQAVDNSTPAASAKPAGKGKSTSKSRAKSKRPASTPSRKGAK
ncbi:cation:proton antiporter [Rhizobium sp. CG5]|uniref:cation:proton antiporter n=1 Tax=Rhizobium sp. CG5 TaxID=2726076 RepID=UPI002033C5E9|nr:cation:proton antiporter [Rhizobium sp. CG5]MCM2476522.1 cation:proton antiporter [Rhizobium sp. CG5]